MSKRTKILLAALIAVIIIGLAVGLGVGLTVGGGNDDGDGNSGDDSGPTGPAATSGPRPTGVWQPAVNASWQIILQAPIELSSDATSVTPDVEIYDIDLFTNDQEVFDTLRRLGKKIICYFSAGSYEPGRPDSGNFADSDKGKELDGWPGEHWLNLSSENVRNIMQKRIQLAHDKGCDAIDPDNVDGYNNDNGLDLTPDDSVAFMEYLSSVSLPLNLSMGLKNAGDIIDHVLNITHFSVNEQCVQYAECEQFSAYINDTKPVFHIEYPDDVTSLSTDKRNGYCEDQGDAAYSNNFSTVLKNMNLDGYVDYCSGMSATTPLNTTGLS
ncbi:hypothetical protein EJ05DRAFT_438107 [Pseudovirgaria hyperparasitica]|uniref:alpha-galactosidase n=1 Tax=Pseudovirgaria hyperparasitica TaxID=470096 RepID=A0A6A6W7E8_9PEZI|nr:uncharacterized protein EJ05DRAFT_438107 [Pseudovirgaria hyperparasitica]KAF2758818.1 hypothetical protein EJ05DRAFT_438107 [Pseudovirgaria hyperparasitica]